MSITSSDFVAQTGEQDGYVGNFGVIAFVILAIFAVTATMLLPPQPTEIEQANLVSTLGP